jgi:hypothetical protein
MWGEMPSGHGGGQPMTLPADVRPAPPGKAQV